MYLEKIKTPGLSHLSYIIGSGGKAAVIDPRRDCDIYVEKARAEGLRITYILETHRNEDLVSGSPLLAEVTGASVYHGYNPHHDVAFATTARDGDCFEIGQLRLEVIETPGHTDDHLAFAIHDSEYPEGAVGVFTGDALFVGDVGRTDFYPDRAREVAGLLYDSLQKLLDLGDQAIIYPAHGAGSVCGSGMAEREFSTIGHERANNPRLQFESRDAFIDFKVCEQHYKPPYFELMERLNVEGASAAPRVMTPQRVTLCQLRDACPDHLIDIREPLAFASGHLPGSYCLPVDMIPAFAGWFVREGETVGLIASDGIALESAVEHLTRIALDEIVGAYIGIVPAAASGEDMRQIPVVMTETVEQRLDEGFDDWTLLDVRDHNERQEKAIEGSEHRYVGCLNEEWRQLDPTRRYTLMCASGMRASVAAGWLASKGFEKVDIYLGSMGAWSATHGG